MHTYNTNTTVALLYPACSYYMVIHVMFTKVYSVKILFICMIWDSNYVSIGKIENKILLKTVYLSLLLLPN